MTRNVFLGADLAPALAALRNPALPSVVSSIYGQVVATDFRTRAEALADEIVASEPDLVGLQEAVVWRRQRPSSALPDRVGGLWPSDHAGVDATLNLPRPGRSERRAVSRTARRRNPPPRGREVPLLGLHAANDSAAGGAGASSSTFEPTRGGT